MMAMHIHEFLIEYIEFFSVIIIMYYNYIFFFDNDNTTKISIKVSIVCIISVISLQLSSKVKSYSSEYNIEVTVN